MTLEKFLKKLETTPRGWKKSGGLIRTPDGQCPIEVVAGMAGAFSAAGPALGLSNKAIEDIVAASDTRSHSPELRARLLEACGLKEEL